jgi:hypothetical protein
MTEALTSEDTSAPPRTGRRQRQLWQLSINRFPAPGISI